MGSFLLSGSVHILYFLIFAFGVVLSLVYKDRLGRAASVSAAGFAVLLAGAILACAYSAYIIFILPRQPVGSGNFYFISAAYGIVSFLVNLLGYLLVMIAMFMKRHADRA